MGTEYILDTNILIYTLGGNDGVLTTLKSLHRGYFFVSALSYFELLVGAKTLKEENLAIQLLNKCVPLELNKDIMVEAVRMGKEQTPKLKLKDLLIAATAKVEKLTLVTADKDFKKIKNLQIKLIKL